MDAVGKRFMKQYGPAVETPGHGLLPPEDATMPAAQAQSMKQQTYRVLGDKAYTGELKAAAVEAQKSLARGAKEEVANIFPEIAGLNQRDSALIELNKALDKAIYGRISNRNPLSLGVKATAGNMKTVVMDILDSPSVKSRLAIAMNSARKAQLGRGTKPIDQFTTAALLSGKLLGGSDTGQ